MGGSEGDGSPSPDDGVVVAPDLLRAGPEGGRLAIDLVEAAPDPLVIHDGDTILYLNQQALAVLEVDDPASVVGRTVWSFLPEEQHAAVRAWIEQMARTGERIPPREVPLSMPGRQVVWGEFVSSPVEIGGRRVFQTIIRDITKRKRAELALSESEGRFRSLFDAVPVGLYRSRPDGTLMSANQALVRMLGFPDVETLLATPIQKLYMDPADREQWIEEVQGKGLESDREIRLRTYHGGELWARLSTRVQYAGDGSIECFEGALEDITESRRATERFEFLFETMAQGVVFHDDSGAITVANPAAERILGVDGARMRGRTVSAPEWHIVRPDGSPWSPEDRPAAVALREGRPVRGAIMGVHNPVLDELRWIELDSYPLFRRGEDRPHQVYSVFADVTERRNAEEQLRQSERRLERALAGSNLGLWDWDIRTGELYLGRRWFTMLGYDPGGLQLDYDGWLDMIHPEDRAGAEAELGRHLRGETPFYECELRIRAADGGWRWILDRGQVVERAEDGEPLHASGTHTDVTDRREAEEALRRSEDRFASIVRAAPMGITLSRVRDGAFLEVNREFAELLGYRREELLSQRSLDLGVWVDPADRTVARRELEGGGSLRGLPVRFRTRSGDIRHVLLHTELIDVEGEPCALTMHQDVTESRRLEEQLRQAQKMEAIGRLAGGIAHDFNNMLTALVGHVKFLMDGLEEGGELWDEALGIQESAERAKRLTRQLLAFSRQQMMNPRLVDLGEVVASFEPLLRRLIGEDVILHVEQAEEACLVVVDPGQLEQVVLNLVVNARDAMPDGGRLSIRSRCRTIDEAEAAGMADPVPAGRYAVLTVTDTGIGMDGETMERIFDPFFTTKPTGRGTGLGLSTVYGIVNQSSGHIRVESEPGTGTTFALYLPATSAGRPEEPGPDAGTAPVAAGGGSEQVLLVEDEEAVRSLAARVLKRAGYTVHAAADAAEALTLLPAIGPIDLLVTDVVMPGMNGRQLADRLRSGRAELPVIFMSGYTADEAIRDREHRSGFFLEKPFTPDQLVAAVRRTLDR